MKRGARAVRPCVHAKPSARGSGARRSFRQKRGPKARGFSSPADEQHIIGHESFSYLQFKDYLNNPSEFQFWVQKLSKRRNNVN
jgi:hypothetical protein